MKSKLPTKQDIEELVSFLPKLYAHGFTPIEKWVDGNKNENGAITMAWPDYNETVRKFFKSASSECWRDYTYKPEEVSQMLEDIDIVKKADLNQVKTMLTYCVRGERFCDGHWGAMIERGHIRNLLQRLSEVGRIFT